MQSLVGWEREEGSENKPYAHQTQSESGLTYQQAHPLLTLDNIASALPDDTTERPAYDHERVYKKGEVMLWGDKKWVARRSVPAGVTPIGGDYNDDYNDDFTTAYWMEWSKVGNYLDKAVRDGVAQMVNTFVATKDIDGKSKSLLEHKCLFDGHGRAQNTITPTGSLVGMEIKNLRGMGVTTILHRLGLQMSGGNGVVKMYLFHTSQREPVAMWDCRFMPGKSYQWFNLQDQALPYMSDDTASGGTWYLCYNEQDLPQGMVSVCVNRDFTKGPCADCNPQEAKNWREITRFVTVSPFRMEVDTPFGGLTPTIESWEGVTYTPKRNYGMNLELSVACDLTDFIISEKHLFARPLQLQVAANVLRMIAYNPYVNVNRNQLNVSRQDIIMDIEGNNYTKTAGMLNEITRAYKALDINTSDMDSVCLACKRHGISFMGI